VRGQGRAGGTGCGERVCAGGGRAESPSVLPDCDENPDA
jgi:hypothetical protein